ncbi:MAG TPA: hypothetical protein VG963_28330 [Polyangiaceae bacterium]|nr:hypothetical protein [Polyangiaceae bacterium]
MAELSSSPESRALTRLKQWHRADRAPSDFRTRVAERLAQLEAPARRRALSRRGGMGLLLLAAAAAVALAVRADRMRVTPLPEQPAALHTADIISLSGAAVPGSLRWHSGGAADGSNQLECQYWFSLELQGSAPIRVHWKQCEFPRELHDDTQRRSSPVTGPLRVFVSGRWSAPGQLEATEIRVLSRATGR